MMVWQNKTVDKTAIMVKLTASFRLSLLRVFTLLARIYRSLEPANRERNRTDHAYRPLLIGFRCWDPTLASAQPLTIGQVGSLVLVNTFLGKQSRNSLPLSHLHLARRRLKSSRFPHSFAGHGFRATVQVRLHQIFATPRYSKSISGSSDNACPVG